MKPILVLYATTDGHTSKIARAFGERLRSHGAQAEVVDAGRPSGITSPADYAAVAVVASVHIGSYQRSVRTWVRAHANALGSMPTAFISSCLGILQDDPKVRQDLDAIKDRFLRDTGWQPTAVKIVAGAVLYTRYGWFKRLMMKRIVRKAGGDTDTSRDYEYTDWEDLRRFADEFLRLVQSHE